MARDGTVAQADEPAGAGTDSIVSYDAVHKVYGQDVVALQDINAEIDEGEFVSLVGPSGCGKTTLLHITAGLIPTTEGTTIVAGRNIEEVEERHNIGLVFQTPVLLEWRTVLDNIMLPIEIMLENGAVEGDRDTYLERAHELIELVGLEGFSESYPSELSGGMQQRVSICRSLIYDPDILLMDEPFGALDAFTRDKLNEELLKIWRETGKTILFVTHNLEEAVFLSDRVIILSSRPGSILDIISVDLDRPREGSVRADDQFHDIVSQAYSFFT